MTERLNFTSKCNKRWMHQEVCKIISRPGAWFIDSHHLHVSGGAIAGIKIVRGVQQVVGRIRKREASGVGVVQIKQQGLGVYIFDTYVGPMKRTVHTVLCLYSFSFLTNFDCIFLVRLSRRRP